MLLLSIGYGRPARAQNDASVIQPVHPEYFNVYNCFPDAVMRPAGAAASNRPMANWFSYNGVCHTPKDVLRVLVIYAGFTNGNVPDSDPNWTQVPNNNNDASNIWPQVLNGSAWGESLPRNANDNFYSNINDFKATATDKSLSNFYYQMSQHSARPFKMLAVNFPIRVNVTATTSINSSSAWYQYNAMVLDKIRTQYQTQLSSLPLADLDQRKNNPDYESDNTQSGPDGQIDYTVIVWRYAGGSPFQTLNLNQALGSGGGGYANISPGYILPASGSTPGLLATDGYTQAQGYSGINPGLYTHEFGHTLYYAPHYNGANGVVGSHYYISPGHGMIGGPMLSSANAWERWFLDWAPLQADGVSGDIDETTFPTGQGTFKLRDFITTGDALRIRLPFTYNGTTNTHQYLWLENHTGKSVWDEARWSGDGQNPAQPFPGPTRGIVAFVEDMRQLRDNPLDGTFATNYEAYVQGADGLKFLSADGNTDMQLLPNTGQTYNNHLWGNSIYHTTGYTPTGTGGYNELAMWRADRDNTGTIGYNPYWNAAPNEGYYYFANDIGPTDGFISPNSGFTRAGQKMGIGENPAITPHQTFDENTQQLSTIELSGLSVELTSVDADGNIEVMVRYQDTDLTKRTRWTGNLAVNDVSGVSYDVNVKGGALLLLDAGSTANRTQPLTPGNFVNPAYLRIRDNAIFHIENDGIVRLGFGSTLYVNDNASLMAAPAGRIYVQKDALLSLPNQNAYNALTISGQLVLLTGGRVEIRQTGQILVGQRGSNFGLSVYPNPATEATRFTLTDAGAGTYSYRLLTPYGTTVRTGTAKGADASRGVTVTGVATGTYLLEVTAEDGTRRTQRFHIQP